MKTGSSGTFVISWSQTESDGQSAAPLEALALGDVWRWTGTAQCVDGPQDVLRLDGAEGVAEVRRRAAQVVRRLIGAAGRARGPQAEPSDGDWRTDQGLVVTDGRESFTLTLLYPADRGTPLLMAFGRMPPADQDLWVVQLAIDRGRVAKRDGGGVICFTPGTRLATPTGPRLIEHLREGDLVLTRDNGAQPVLWQGQRRMTGARLHAMPHLRPIRFRAGALGPDRPDPDLLVSPQHRMLLAGPAARALFITDEVLVAAEDLINDQTITVDRVLREVTYIHVLLDRHNVIWANGMATESFHPANAALDALDPVQREGLLGLFPQLLDNPHLYGDHARRNLSGPEAAILRHDMKM